MTTTKRLKWFEFKSMDAPFKNEREQSKAYRKLFTSKEGRKVLDSLLLDTDYHKPDLPNGVDVTAQLAFNAGKRYVVNHILAAVSAEYEEKNKDDLLTDVGDDYE